jgi:hypothetical protein
MARERLRPDWIAGWLTSPPMFMPGTKMPEFWLQRDNFLEASPLPPEDREFVIRHVPWLAGTGFDAAALGQQSWRTEIEALLQYLMHMNSMEGN